MQWVEEGSVERVTVQSATARMLVRVAALGALGSRSPAITKAISHVNVSLTEVYLSLCRRPRHPTIKTKTMSCARHTTNDPSIHPSISHHAAA